MLSNAVTSAVDRLYAASTPVQPTPRVERVGAVAPVQRIRPVSDAEAGGPPATREDRLDMQQRQALAKGVQAAFEAVLAGERSTAAAPPESAEQSSDPGDRAPQAEEPRPDPLLEQAIMRFIHTMFRSLAEAEGSATAGEVDPTGGRNQLSARIDALAERLVDQPEPGGAAQGGVTLFSDLAGNGAHERTGVQQALDQAFAEVVQALGGNLGGGDSSPELRANLSQLMHRLAQAMHGAPPVDQGLPTRGALLSERA